MFRPADTNGITYGTDDDAAAQTMEYAYRTAAMFRGDNPYAVIIDDYKIDNESDNWYRWGIPIPTDIYDSGSGNYITFSGNVATLVDPTDPTKGLRIEIFDTNGVSGTWDVTVEENDANNNGQIDTNTQLEGTWPILSYRVNSTAAKLRVMMYPFKSGSPTPSISITSPDTYAITVGSVTDNVNIQTVNGKPSTVNIDRDGTPLMNITPNVAPSVSLDSPADAASYMEGDTVTLTATTSDSDGIVAKVEFYANGTKIGEDISAPFSYTWVNVPAGIYALTAVAVDNDEERTTSTAANITVIAPNISPNIEVIIPEEGDVFRSGDAVTITAQASDPDGTVSKVEFYRGGVKLGEDLTEPFTYTWGAIPEGLYALSAVAVDNEGTTSTSALVNISALPAATLVEYLDGILADQVAIDTVSASDASVTSSALTRAGGPAVTGNITLAFFTGSTSPAGRTTNSSAGSEWLNLDSGTVSGTPSTSYLEFTLTADEPAIKLGYLTFDLFASTNASAGQSPAIRYQVETNLDSGGFVTQGSGSVTVVSDGSPTFELETQAVDLSSLTLANAGDSVTVRLSYWDARGTSLYSGGIQGLQITAPLAAAEVELTTPVIETGSESDITSSSATVEFELIDDGGDATTVTIYYGTEDGGENSGNWNFSNSQGVLAAGIYSASLSGLAPDTQYYYTTYATNSVGDHWGSFGVFTTSNDTENIVEYLDGVSTDQSALDTIVSESNSITATNITYVGGPSQSGNITKADIASAQTPAGTTAESSASSEWIALDSGFIANTLGNDYLEFTLTADSPGVTLGNLIFDLFARVNGNSGQSHTIDYEVETNLNEAGLISQATGSVTAVGDGTVVTQLETQSIDLSSITLNNVGDSVAIRINIADSRSNGAYSGGLQGITIGRSRQTSSPVPNLAPNIALSTPSEGDTFADGSNVTITATASDSDGTVAQVEFFEGSNSLGVDATAPYSIAWNSVTEGTYMLTAVATDNDGASTTSSTVNITVAAPITLPVIANESSSNVSFATANIGFDITDDGGEAPTVTVYYGRTNGGTVAANWSESSIMGAVGMGSHTDSLSGLDTGSQYFYRVHASNSAGEAWGSGGTFSTLVDAVNIVEYLDGLLADQNAINTVIDSSYAVTASGLTYAGGPSQNGNITKTSIIGSTTPAGPTTGNSAGSEWLALDSGFIANSFGTDYIEFTLTSTITNLVLGDLVFDLFARVNGNPNQSHTVQYQVETDLNGGGFVAQYTGSVTAVGDGTQVTVLETQTIDLSGLVIANMGDELTIRIGLWDSRNNGSYSGGLQGLRVTKPATANPDSDSDGIEDAWELTYFGNLTTASATSNQDGDGASDYQEYLAGTDPNDKDSYFKSEISDIRTNPNEIDISWTSVSGKSYAIEKSAGLSSWTSVQSAIAATPPSNVVTIAIPQGDAECFFRVVLE